MTKYVFFDIDGTLYDETMIIPQSTVLAIQKLRANGHKAFLCSGRSRGNIRSKNLFDIGFDGVIAACGNHVEMDGKVLYERILAPELVKKIISLCKEHRMPVVLEGPKKHWLDETGFEDDPYVDYLIEEMGEDAVFLNGYTDDIYINKFSADVLKVGHHGSNTSTSEKYLNEVNPDFAVISCGPDNNYGHPTYGVIDKLEGQGVETYITSLQGNITAISDGKKVSFITE